MIDSNGLIFRATIAATAPEMVAPTITHVDGTLERTFEGLEPGAVVRVLLRVRNGNGFPVIPTAARFEMTSAVGFSGFVWRGTECPSGESEQPFDMTVPDDAPEGEMIEGTLTLVFDKAA